MTDTTTNIDHIPYDPTLPHEVGGFWFSELESIANDQRTVLVQKTRGPGGRVIETFRVTKVNGLPRHKHSSLEFRRNSMMTPEGRVCYFELLGRPKAKKKRKDKDV